jgi:hypothetical protein
MHLSCHRIAFFSLFTLSCCLLHRYHLQGGVISIHLHFCFDKSPQNFYIYNFRCTKDPNLIIVAAAAVSCIHHADLLDIPAWWEPIGAVGTFSTCSFLRDSHITTIMPNSCIWVYPNPKHKMRLQIKCIVTHKSYHCRRCPETWWSLHQGNHFLPLLTHRQRTHISQGMLLASGYSYPTGPHRCLPYFSLILALSYLAKLFYLPSRISGSFPCHTDSLISIFTHAKPSAS